MLNTFNLRKITAISLLAISMQTLGIDYSAANDVSADEAPNPTGFLTPSTFTGTTTVGQTISLDRTITIDSIPDVVTTETITQNRKLDVLFLADNTNSMTDAIANIQSNATSLLNTLSDNYGDVQFGVAKYYGDPQEPKCEGCSIFGTDAYELQEAINEENKEQAVAAINQWQSSERNTDWQEGNFFALHQAATNGATVNSFGTGNNTSWRSDAEKVIVWFGDAYSSQDTISETDTIQALKDRGIKVIAIHVDTNTYRLNNGQYLSAVRGLNYRSQASKIARETGGAFASADPAQLSSTILNLIGDAVIETTEETTSAGTVDLAFQAQSDIDLSGLNITYTCTDALGCNDVASGQSRTFRMDVEGITTGVYNFTTKVVGVNNALGTDQVTVVNFPD